MAPPLKTKEEILIVGGSKTGNVAHKNIVFLDKDPNDSIVTEAPLCDYAAYYSLCASKHTRDLIISGGYDHSTKRSSSKVQKFSITEYRWVELPDLPFPLDAHGSAYVDNKMYSIGGRYSENDQIKQQYSSVHVLDLVSLSWEECQSLPIAVEAPGITAIDDKIYAIGGYTGKEWSRQTVQLNTRTGAITQCQSMPKGDCVFYATVAVSQYIYALASTFFLQYNTKRDQWTELNMPLKPSYFAAMVLKQNHLIMLGGYEKDRKNPNDAIQKYDLSSKRWSFEACKMPLPLSRHWAFVMEIPQSK